MPLMQCIPEGPWAGEHRRTKEPPALPGTARMQTT